MHQVMINELDDELVLSLKVQGEKKRYQWLWHESWVDKLTLQSMMI